MSDAPLHDALIVGAGPAGLLLAAELARRGVDVALLERRRGGGAGTRAIGVHPPVLAALEASGATERLLAGAARVPRGVARGVDRSGARVLGEVRFDRARARFPFVATAPQALTEAAVGRGAPEPVRGLRIDALAERGDHVAARGVAEPGGEEREVRARVAVIAAGAAGRPLAAFATPRSRSYADRYLMTDLAADAAGARDPGDAAVVTVHPEGVLESFPLPDGGRRLVAWDGAARRDRPAGGELERLRRAVARRSGDEALAAGVTRASAFGIRRVLLPRMRAGRILVIGDAAHEVSPIGGQGMNLGLLDAAALAPILAAWCAGRGSDADLDRWERARLASARTAARLAGLNTALGRPRGPLAHRVLTAALGAALSGPLAAPAARAYAMGFDRAARVSRPARP